MLNYSVQDAATRAWGGLEKKQLGLCIQRTYHSVQKTEGIRGAGIEKRLPLGAGGPGLPRGVTLLSLLVRLRVMPFV